MFLSVASCRIAASSAGLGCQSSAWPPLLVTAAGAGAGAAELAREVDARDDEAGGNARAIYESCRADYERARGFVVGGSLRK